MEKQLNKNNALVCKHNNLINASFKLNLGEQKLVLAISSMVNPFDEDFKEYFLSVYEFAELMNIDLNKNTGLYSRLKRKSSILLSKRLTIHESDGDLQTTWFASIKYFNDEGKMAFCFAPRLKKYYLQLQQFTKYRLKNIADLNSQYSIRIYELLKQYEKLKIRKFELAEFKNLIGIENTQYSRFYDFKNRVLLVAQKELKEKTDIYFDFKEIKTGRKVTSIKFYIYPNPKNINDELSATREIEPIKGQIDVKNYELVDQVKQILPTQLTNDNLQALLQQADNDLNKIKVAYNVFKEYQKNHTVNDIMGFLISAIKSNWTGGQAIGQDNSTNRFINFKQREDWDFEEIERLEQEYLKRSLEENK